MRVVVDTNIVFSALLNTDGRIAHLLLQPKSGFNFYSTRQLLDEVHRHRSKIKKMASYSDEELDKIISIITGKIRFVDVRLIPKHVYIKAELLTKDIDEDDTEFVALTEHTRAKLWSGDKVLLKGLKSKNWLKFITTEDLYISLKSKL